MSPTRIADQRRSAAATRKVTETLVVATRTPPSAGPTKIPTLSIVVAVTLAAVSSSGLRARFGTSAA